MDLRATEATGLNDEERAALTAAREKATQAAAKLVEVALSDPDAIFGPYFKEPQAAEPWPGGGSAFEWTAVDGLLNRRPDLFQEAAANEEAMAALWKAGENAPSRRNAGRMLKIAWALCGYAQKHDQVYPPEPGCALRARGSQSALGTEVAQNRETLRLSCRLPKNAGEEE